jgi:hypothetical protein
VTAVAVGKTPFQKWVGGLQCLLCGDNTSVEVCHIRYGDLRAGKRAIGIGERSGDWAIPLCGRHHREQHTRGERNWWAEKGVDPVKASAALQLAFRLSHPHMAEMILAAHLIEGPDGHR